MCGLGLGYLGCVVCGWGVTLGGAAVAAPYSSHADQSGNGYTLTAPTRGHLYTRGPFGYGITGAAALQRAGALLNGSTSPDRTNYWEVVPTGALELALWMESDRMGYLLPALTEEKFQNQRDVVINERRQNYENRPYGFALMALASALYPSVHPYHWLTIGEVAVVLGYSEPATFYRAFKRWTGVPPGVYRTRRD